MKSTIENILDLAEEYKVSKTYMLNEDELKALCQRVWDEAMEEAAKYFETNGDMDYFVMKDVAAELREMKGTEK